MKQEIHYYVNMICIFSLQSHLEKILEKPNQALSVVQKKSRSESTRDSIQAQEVLDQQVNLLFHSSILKIYYILEWDLFDFLQSISRKEIGHASQFCSSWVV